MKLPLEVRDIVIVTSNIDDVQDAKYIVNYSSYLSHHEEIIDNAGLMSLRILSAAGVKEVIIAGMDGYTKYERGNYSDEEIDKEYFLAAELKNQLISEELREINKFMCLKFITATHYII